VKPLYSFDLTKKLEVPFEGFGLFMYADDNHALSYLEDLNIRFIRTTTTYTNITNA
jgi:hypothetical protein